MPFENHSTVFFFGDIFIQSGEVSSANLGKKYKLPDNMERDSVEARSYLGGAENFKVKEIEVFTVKF